jgi:hypothetical protein
MTGSVLTDKDANGNWTVTILRDCGHTVESPRRLNAEGPAERHGRELLEHPCLGCALREMAA